MQFTHDRKHANRWPAWLAVGILFANLPVAAWLAFWAPHVPTHMAWNDLVGASTEVRLAFLLGGRWSLSVVVGLTTAVGIVLFASVRCFGRLRSAFSPRSRAGE